MFKKHLISISFFLIILYKLSGQTYTSYFTGNPADTVSSPLGGICLMGGATENDEAMKWFLTRCSGGDVLVLRASGSNGYNNYLYNQLGVKVHSVESIVFNDMSASGEQYIQNKIKQAEAIWLAGGDQWDYVNYWRGTAIDSLINDGIVNRHIVIGGTSAGMAVMGGFYFSAHNGSVTSAEALSNPYNSRMTVDSSAFIKNAILKKVITDTHYDNPDRRGRQVAFLARILTDFEISAKGIACEEYTAVCIDTSGIARCYGNFPKDNDYAYFLQINCETDYNVPENCVPGSVLEWNRGGKAIKVYKVPGDASGSNSFNLKDWKTGNGGAWEDWSVKQGVLQVQSGNEPACLSQSIKTFVPVHEFRIFPNPTSDGKVQIDFPFSETVQISISDIRGKTFTVIRESALKSFPIDLSNLAKGIYVVRLTFTGMERHSLLVLN